MYSGETIVTLAGPKSSMKNKVYFTVKKTFLRFFELLCARLASKLAKNANIKKLNLMLISNPLKSCKKVPKKQYCVRNLFSAL
jgi:hypothetical protein